MERKASYNLKTPKSPKLSRDYNTVLRKLALNQYDSSPKVDPLPTVTESYATSKSNIHLHFNKILSELKNPKTKTSTSPIHFDISSDDDYSPFKSEKLNIEIDQNSDKSTQTDFHSTPNISSPLETNDGKKRFLLNNRNYTVLNQLGQGGSSKVYQVFDCDCSKLMALKVVDLSVADASCQEGYRNEILLLKKMKDSSRVVDIYDFEFREKEKLLLILMEKGDNDLVTILKKTSGNGSLGPIEIKFYWSELLKTVDAIHEAGIIHRDLKPANFVQVMGRLKLIDFGIASALKDDMTSIIQNNPIGTVSYMPPEALCGAGLSNTQLKIRPKSDVWSLGCILHQMVFGKHPFQNIQHLVSKIQAITSDSYQLTFPALDDQHLLDVIKSCLIRDPFKRPSIKELLRHPYLSETVQTQLKTESDQVEDLINKIKLLTPESKSRISKIL